MLDYQLTIDVSDKVWESATAQAQVTIDDEEYFAASSAPAPLLEDTRRRYHRVQVRGRALALRGKDRYGVFTIDISPMGVGFYSPVPLLPREQIILCFEPAEQLSLNICRCIRTEGTTYSCGGEFASGPLSPTGYKKFISSLRS